MPTFTAKDKTTLHYKDWGTGQPIVFGHGWPLSGDAWEKQMLFLAEKGYRCIAHDRRGHGRSDQPWTGNDMDTYADDLAALIDHLGLEKAVLVGHSTGGGEVTRYIGRHGSGKVAGLVLIGAVTPGMLKTDKNPDGLPMSVFDGIRDGVRKDRAQFFKDLTAPFFGANREGHHVTEGMRETFVSLGLQGSLKAEMDCIAAFSESEFTPDLAKCTMPVLVIHGDDDQIVPVANTARRVVELVKHAELKLYKGGSHGLPITETDQINADLLTFAQTVFK